MNRRMFLRKCLGLAEMMVLPALAPHLLKKPLARQKKAFELEYLPRPIIRKDFYFSIRQILVQRG